MINISENMHEWHRKRARRDAVKKLRNVVLVLVLIALCAIVVVVP
jgi:hypothetical protein